MPGLEKVAHESRADEPQPRSLGFSSEDLLQCSDGTMRVDKKVLLTQVARPGRHGILVTSRRSAPDRLAMLWQARDHSTARRSDWLPAVVARNLIDDLCVRLQRAEAMRQSQLAPNRGGRGRELECGNVLTEGRRDLPPKIYCHIQYRTSNYAHELGLRRRRQLIMKIIERANLNGKRMVVLNELIAGSHARQTHADCSFQRNIPAGTQPVRLYQKNFRDGERRHRESCRPTRKRRWRGELSRQLYQRCGGISRSR